MTALELDQSETGIVLSGRVVGIPGLSIIPPASHGGPPWATLDPGDYRPRPPVWIRQLIVHSTAGRWPQPIVPGSGPGGEAARLADIWSSDPVHSGSQIVVDSSGTVACLCDAATTMAYHAEGSNLWSIGIEMFQRPDGGIYQATIAATAKLCLALCDALGIPAQLDSRAYGGTPLSRMEHGAGHLRDNTGGPDVVGIMGHRDNTGERGRGDPGDAIYAALLTAGAEPLDFASCEDLAVARRRQAALNARGERLTVDGLVGPASIAAARRHGFARWRDVE
ncbi:MAG TPA: N-acetylmuramoyl-L-alanine amidase [Kofleriaceae bacterium]|jgi:hypothetical protein|nr:N-acetylmuramoyl-L-alanine amidase [Kofleriaceae bacterium]